jgi:hypothetical protein
VFYGAVRQGDDGFIFGIKRHEYELIKVK